MKPNQIKMTALLFGFSLLSACGGPKDIDKIADAQNCLDHASASQVSDCVSKVDGLESDGAYTIRCTGKFVKEGFNDISKLATALSSVSGTSTGASGSADMMAALAFKAESTVDLDYASAQEALDYCNRSNSKGLILLAGLSLTSTSVAKYAGVADPSTMTGAQIQTLMGSLQSDPGAQAAVGSAVTSIYTSSCSNNSTTAGNYCAQFESAVSAVPGGLSNPQGIGQQIMICYNNPSAAGCSGF